MKLFRLRSAAVQDSQEHADVQESPSAHTNEARIAGERAESLVSRPPSLQSRVSNALALGLFGSLAIGFLTWYYMNTAASRANERAAAQSVAKGKADGEMVVPPLGRIDPPSRVEQFLGPAPEEPPPADIPEAWLQSAADPPVANRTYSRAVQETPERASKTPEELAMERQLSGSVFSAAAVQPIARDVGGTANRQSQAGELDAYLTPNTIPAVQAKVLPTQRLLLPKGAFVDCTLETAIDSTLPGMTTCVMATDAFSADGSVVLLERGTKLIGETRGQVRHGAARMFVLWNEARTPSGIVVPLASPGTDELGRSGLSGEVDTHFWDRFGAAILISVIDGGIQAAAQAQRESGDTLIVSPSGSRDVMTEVLKSTLDIPPTVRKANGDRIQILVARDVDFRSVYELKLTARRQ